MLFEDFLTSYIEDMETGRRTKKGRTVKVSPAYIKGLRIIQKQIRNYQKEENHMKEFRNKLIVHGLMKINDKYLVIKRSIIKRGKQ